MNIKPKLREIKQYLDNTESYIGRYVGLLGGAVAAGVRHYPEYLDRLHSVQGFLEHTEVNLQYAAKSLDELIAGVIIGTAVGAGIKYIRSRRK